MSPNDSTFTPIRARWTTELTAVYMANLAALTNEGLFNSHRPQMWAPAWPRLLEAMQKADPVRPWSRELMMHKRKSERRRYLEYQALVNQFANGNGEDGKGCPILSDEQWESFLRIYPTGKWLRKTPLGNKEIYARAFPADKPTGAYAVEPGQELTHYDRVGTSVNSLRFCPENRRENRQENRQETDEEDNGDEGVNGFESRESSGNLAVENNPLHKSLYSNRPAKRPGQQVDLESFERAFLESSCRIQSSFGVRRAEGADDLEKAIRYFSYFNCIFPMISR
ncbi:uncharacterized protein F4812DRAFT_411608 [Daldinia caldariorum]|uniref:uncharacterized protein n=1 Tax=Daldinia caldariorum TaxID=326644 RepID=UPI0020084A61|nr:uncharacterized protein F4812DRAFT_411608 [Daldinia caldariorum]KAI1473100.1 hypothetical protein F4812DRAFT_411608 [Daldinia caldariorum]